MDAPSDEAGAAVDAPNANITKARIHSNFVLFVNDVRDFSI
jgi:hypothetical protein